MSEIELVSSNGMTSYEQHELEGYHASQLGRTSALSKREWEAVAEGSRYAWEETGQFALFGAQSFNDPRDAGNEDHVNFWLTPHAQALNAATAMRASAVKEGIDFGREIDGQSRIAVVSGNTVGRNGKVYDFSDKDIEVFAAGSFRPQADRVLRIAEGLGAKSISVFGWSEGASVAASVAAHPNNDIDIKEVMLGEPPNVVARTPKQLEKDFRSTGLGRMFKAQREGGLPVFMKVQGTNFPYGGLALDLVKFGLSSTRIKSNRALVEAMSQDTLQRTLDSVPNPKDTSYTFARGLESTITPVDVDLPASARQRNTVHVEGYGHEIHDNLRMLSCLAMIATLSDKKV